MKRLITIFLLNLLFAVTAFSQQKINISGEEVLTQLLSVYASCNSYSDAGNVEEIIITKERTWTDNRPFKTAFVRPSLFYFEYQEQFQNQDEWKKYMVWETKEGVHSWWSIQPQTRDFSSLAMALAGPTGVSRHASYNIPVLLREDVKRRGHRFQMTSTFSIIGEETIDGIAAYKLEGKNRFPQMKEPIQSVTIWIDKERFLLLKIYDKRTLQSSETGDDFEVESTTIYTPQINIEIPAERFKVSIPTEP